MKDECEILIYGICCGRSEKLIHPKIQLFAKQIPVENVKSGNLCDNWSIQGVL
jgi:hypothetical protein